MKDLSRKAAWVFVAIAAAVALSGCEFLLKLLDEPPSAIVTAEIVGSGVHLVGTASSDQEGDTLSFEWGFVNVPAGSSLTEADIASVAQGEATFVPDCPGTYVVRLTVRDGHGLEDSATVTIVVGQIGAYTASVELLSVSPASPASLALEENVTVEFSYQTDDPAGVRIFCRPMSGGELTPNYGAHPSGLHTGSGTGTGWFHISAVDGEMLVDQLRIQAWNADLSAMYAECYYDVQYTVPTRTDYSASVELLSLSPPSPASLGLDEDVTVEFSYQTDDPEGVRIFCRPMTAGELTPDYGAHASGLYAGSGTGTGWFHISAVDGEAVIDQIRIQVVSADQMETYAELLWAVEYTVTDGGRYTASVELLSLSPASPGILELGQQVNVKFSYETDDPDGIRIWCRPRDSTGWCPNHTTSSPSPLYTGTGTGTAWFYFPAAEGDFTIEQLVISACPSDSYESYVERSFDVLYEVSSDAGFTASVDLISLSPASPGALSVNETLSLRFSYETDGPTGIKIYCHPCSGRGGIFPSSVSSSTFPAGTGTAVVGLKVLGRDSPVTMDGILVEVWRADERVMCLEYRLDVLYEVSP
jgi:hypothetical protein